MPVREERLSVFIKYAHILEEKAKGHRLRMSWVIIPLLVTGRPCPALCFSWCRNGLVPLQVSPESARGRGDNRQQDSAHRELDFWSSSGVAWTGLGALRVRHAVCLSAQ